MKTKAGNRKSLDELIRDQSRNLYRLTNELSARKEALRADEERRMRIILK